MQDGGGSAERLAIPCAPPACLIINTALFIYLFMRFWNWYGFHLGANECNPGSFLRTKAFFWILKSLMCMCVCLSLFTRSVNAKCSANRGPGRPPLPSLETLQILMAPSPRQGHLAAPDKRCWISDSWLFKSLMRRTEGHFLKKTLSEAQGSSVFLVLLLLEQWCLICMINNPLLENVILQERHNFSLLYLNVVSSEAP